MIAAVICLLRAAPVYAAPAGQPVTISWKAVAGAGGYLIEAANAAGDVVLSEKVPADVREKTIRLPPGRYNLRMTTLNRFLRPEESTEWILVLVQSLEPPVFISLTPRVMVTGRPQSMRLKADGMAPDAAVAVVTPSSQDLRAPTERVSQSDFVISLPPLKERGDYTIVLTNPPDLKTAVPAAFSAAPAIAAVDKIQPDKVETSRASAVIELIGREFSPFAQVSMVGSEKRSIPIQLKITEIHPDSITLEIPQGLDPGTYELDLINEPGESPVAVSAQRVTIVGPRSPVFKAIAPKEILTNTAQSVTVNADDLGEGAEAEVRSPSGTGVTVNVQRSSEGDLVIQLPPLKEAGAYTIVLRNPPGQGVAAPGVLMVRLPQAVIRRIEPETITSNQAAADVRLSGSDFAPDARIFLVSADKKGEPIPLTKSASDSVSITATIPAGLDPGTYDLSLVNEPDADPVHPPAQHITILPPIGRGAHGRKLLISAGWLLEVPLGDWGAIYHTTPAGAAVRADYFLTPHAKPESGSALDFALGADARFVSFGKNGGSSFVPSSLSNLTVAIDPSLTWSLPFMSVTARLGGGLTYSGLDASSDTGGSSQFSSSIDISALSELNVLFPISDWFTLGVSASFHHLFLTHSMDLFGASSFVSVNF